MTTPHLSSTGNLKLLDAVTARLFALPERNVTEAEAIQFLREQGGFTGNDAEAGAHLAAAIQAGAFARVVDGTKHGESISPPAEEE